ncbi:MAG: response regulator transcription factor [Chloroflexi bacterium]|nr:response regulator transcription factor [Chloroflexota bacterium]
MKGPTDLTARQWQILELVSRGLANKEIATRLSLSEPGVKKHVSALMRTFLVPNRVSLVRRAVELELIRFDLAAKE